MNGAELLRLPGLPALASDRRVSVELVAALELDECGECPEHVSPIPTGVMAIRYSQWGHDNLVTAACSPECADRALTWLLRERPNPKDRPRNIRLLIPQRLVQDLPSGPLQTPEATGDQAFADLEACVKHLHDLRNPCRGGEAWDAFELMRKAALAAVSQIGLKRVGDLETRAAA